MASQMKLSIVIPCFNEEEVLPTTINHLTALVDQLIEKKLITPESTITFIDDGSGDETWHLIEAAAHNSNKIHGIKLSKNRGHQNALIAGLFTVDGDVIISIDADLQDDLSAIQEMLIKHHEGAEIVYGIRSHRETDTRFKRASAEGYYRLMRLLGVDVIFNHADYRLMGRVAINALEQYGEVNLFLRGIIPQLGFKTANVYYSRAERFAGESKYPFKKMLSFAWEGLTSFSSLPLRWITIWGFLVSIFSFGFGLWATIVSLFTNEALPGWASTVIPMYFLGGVQLLSLGIIGEYVSKIYSETKRRPRYIIEKSI
jgi:glycosyltransferase involved in cell wall biosynthesis